MAMLTGVLLGAGVGTELLAARMITQGGRVEAVRPPQPEEVVRVEDSLVTQEPFRTLSARDLALRMEEAARLPEKAVMLVLDGNSQQAFAQAHVPGAVLLVDEALDPRVLPRDRRAFIALVCDRVRLKRCQDAARQAADLGYQDVAVIPDANEQWQQLGRTLEGEGV